MARGPQALRPDGDGVALRERAALLGHDIRNAVSDILGGLSIADLSPLDAGSGQQLVRVRSAAEQLARLSDEVLALVTGEAGPALDRGAGLRMAPLLEALEARWAAHASEWGLSFRLVCGEDLPAVIGIDRGALERILANLIGNAIKHSGRGEVRLTVTLGAQETLSFCVEDDGPGFSEAALALLFERHGRAPGNDTPGSGLGLHIVHDLAHQIGSQMEVRNRPEGGARICLRLPRVAWAPGVSGHMAQDLPDLTGQCVLVAEDNQTNQLLIRQMLETLGADCDIAPDGQAALELLKRKPFNLALIDIEMPRLSGLDLIRTLRRWDGDAAGLPVLAVTAYVLSANRAEIYEAGADGILAKPIMSLESFGQAIAGVMRKPAAAPRAGSAAPLREPPFNPLHLNRLLALAGIDSAQELLRRLRQDFEAVRQGLVRGLEDQDVALIRAQTHVLISLAGAIGADCLQGRAGEINAAANAGDMAVARSIGPRVIERLGQIVGILDSEYAERFGKVAP